MNPPNTHAINWFEIPTVDLDRAITFYETLLATTITREQCSDIHMGIFPYQPEQGVGGALIAMPEIEPSTQGAILYLNAGHSLSTTLARLDETIGRIVWPATELPDNMGFFAHILDSEGNRIGLHAMNA
ncbi:MAG: VOC family protein [Pseudomonadota bacterium]|nr:VOC family protein [Pseudomonadota bacterium]